MSRHVGLGAPVATGFFCAVVFLDVAVRFVLVVLLLLHVVVMLGVVVVLAVFGLLDLFYVLRVAAVLVVLMSSPFMVLQRVAAVVVDPSLKLPDGHEHKATSTDHA